MNRMKLWMLAILVCSLGLFTACSSVDQAVVKPEQGTAFRAMLKSLDWGTDTTFVYGHKTPDVEDGLYFIYYGEGAKAVAEAIFGTSLRPGVTF